MPEADGGSGGKGRGARDSQKERCETITALGPLPWNYIFFREENPGYPLLSLWLQENNTSLKILKTPSPPFSLRILPSCLRLLLFFTLHSLFWLWQSSPSVSVPTWLADELTSLQKEKLILEKLPWTLRSGRAKPGMQGISVPSANPVPAYNIFMISNPQKNFTSGLWNCRNCKKNLSKPYP